MIPRRISLRGFLCYREEKEVDFSGSTLWMLAGLNGSGKSAIFDAVTYALFGHHRGGSQQAGELINKDSDAFQVEFDFLLDDELYRAKRTLRKTNRGTTTATQQISRHRSVDDRPGRWEPVEDTSRKIEYDRWVRDHLGLTYETFTSSVLLLQGRAEKLLDSTAKGRFEVLAGIVDLERYARLHAKADDRRRNLKAQAEALQNQLAATPEIAAEEVATAEEQINGAEARLTTARVEVERWQFAEFQARRWADLQTRGGLLADRWRAAQALIAEADEIEKDAERFAELTAVLPHLESAVKQRGQIAESQRKSDELNLSYHSGRERLTACDHALGQGQQKRAALQKSIATAEQRQRDLQGRLRRLEAVRAQMVLLEQQRQELRRHEEELARLPADITDKLAAAEAEREDAATASLAAPLLGRLVQAKTELKTARDRERQAGENERAVKDCGESLSAEIAALAPELEAKSAERQKADDDASAAKALLRQARDEEKAFRELEGARVCRQCGQELTPGHFEREHGKRRSDVRAAEKRVAETTAGQSAAQQAEADLRKRLTALEAERQEKRDAYRDLRRQIDQARGDADRLIQECAAAYQQLPDVYRDRIAARSPTDWLTVSGPAPQELDAVKTKAASLVTATAAVRRFREQHTAWTNLSGRLQSLRQSVDAIAAGLPGEPDELHREFTRAEADEHAAAAELKAARSEARVVQEELDRLTAERQEVEADVSRLAGQLQAEEVTRRHCQQSLQSATAALPERWRPAAETAKLTELHGWKTERDNLAERNVQQQARELQQARAGLESLRHQKEDFDREVAAFPTDARRPVAEVQDLLRAARQESDVREEDVRQARHRRALLEERQRRRADLQAAALDVDRAHSRQSLLADLLSRNRLQLYLVRQAERQIVDHANAVLDRLSGGQLFLRLGAGDEGDVSDKALELEAYNRTTAGGAINVAFLSGSQRFRVAVSLALGIGQYASRAHRPIESVIIDEGFGCLDRNGRQVMIQELQNLRSHLRCILLVSHQDEFAEAFSDGYRFELTDGTTQVRRFSR